MKVRTGFVSNSSSSSFVCVGMKIGLEDLLRNRDAIAEQRLQFCANQDWWEYGDEIEIHIGVIRYDGDPIDLPIGPLSLGKRLAKAGLITEKQALTPPIKAYGGQCDYANPLDTVGDEGIVDEVMERIKNEDKDRVRVEQ